MTRTLQEIRRDMKDLSNTHWSSPVLTPMLNAEFFSRHDELRAEVDAYFTAKYGE